MTIKCSLLSHILWKLKKKFAQLCRFLNHSSLLNQFLTLSYLEIYLTSSSFGWYGYEWVKELWRAKKMMTLKHDWLSARISKNSTGGLEVSLWPEGFSMARPTIHCIEQQCCRDVATHLILTPPMLRLLSSKAQWHKDFWKQYKPCHVGIH